MARYICKNKCHWNGRIWHEGEKVELDLREYPDFPEKHFRKVGGGDPEPAGPARPAKLTGLDKMGVKKLMDLARNMGIGVDNNDTKAMLIEKINAKRAEEEGGSEE